jgi:hypothetical protein
MSGKVVKYSAVFKQHNTHVNSGGSGDSGGDDIMEARVAKIESAVEYVLQDISNIRHIDLKDIKAEVKETKEDIKSINKEIVAIKVSIPQQTIAIIGILTGILTIAVAVLIVVLR